jgi:formylglycine-generating enzyme required for sulfatase activity
MHLRLTTLLLCVGTTFAYGQQGKKANPAPQPTATGKQNTGGFAQPNTVTLKSGTGNVEPPPQEGVNFYGSSIAHKGWFVWIPAGTFQMGSTWDSDPDRSEDETQHWVTFDHGFWLLDHEVTQKQYQSVMSSNPSLIKGENLPVDRVTWEEADAFCKKLTERDQKAGKILKNQVYRLPTEAEWEYACRAGTSTAIYTYIKTNGKETREGSLPWIAWFAGNTDKKRLREVRQKIPNRWLLYDMLGNVSEWCSDWYGDYEQGTKEKPLRNPKGPTSQTASDPNGQWTFGRVNRGSSVGNPIGNVRSAQRWAGDLGTREPATGFRVALSVDRTK